MAVEDHVVKKVHYSFSFLCFFFFRKLGVRNPLLFFSFFEDFSEADKSSLLLLDEVSGCPAWRLLSSPFTVVSPARDKLHVISQD